MKTLDREHVRSVVNTIFSQFLHTTSIDVINSWGISKMYATQIVKNVNGEDFTMAALVMLVNGFQFQGKVYIGLDEGSDYCEAVWQQEVSGHGQLHLFSMYYRAGRCI